MKVFGEVLVVVLVLKVLDENMILIIMRELFMILGWYIFERFVGLEIKGGNGWFIFLLNRIELVFKNNGICFVDI